MKSLSPTRIEIGPFIIGKEQFMINLKQLRSHTDGSSRRGATESDIQ